MTSANPLALASPGPWSPWPGPDVLVLRGRTIRPGTPAAQLSRFGDQVWILQPAHPDAHQGVNSVHWTRFPAHLVLPFKTFCLAVLDHPVPGERAVSTGVKFLAVQTLSARMRHIRVFATWMDDHGLKMLSEVTDRHLERYRQHVRAMDCRPARRADLLHAVLFLHAYHEHLPASCRMATRASPWGGTIDHDELGLIWIKGENKTPKIAPTTMENLLAWSLWMLEEAGPDIVAAHQARTASESDPSSVINGTINGQPWRDEPISPSELPDLVRMLFAAGAVIVCYLSGMRPGECLNLRKGCRDTDPDTGELLLNGRRGKGKGRTPAADPLRWQQGEAEPEEDTLNRPWVVVQPVHDAIALLERLRLGDLIFPSDPKRSARSGFISNRARSSTKMARDINGFVTWVNHTFTIVSAELPIPPDPTKRLHLSRFRRTLAYFIVRQPRGLIAAALQYGHVSTLVTLNYSGSADTGWMNDLAVERLEMVVEQTEEDTDLLEDGEHVSGPAADEYRTRIARSVPFAGQVINHARNVERLLASIDPNIHHGEGMTCVWTRQTAACERARIEAGLPSTGQPDQAECRTTCQNLAYTDRDIDLLHHRIGVLDATAADPLTPRPLRDRAAAQAARTKEIIDHHGRSRPTSITFEGDDA